MARTKRRIDYRRVERFTRSIQSWFVDVDHMLYAEGFSWYPNATQQLRLIALQHESTLEISAGICAALSPKLRWSENLLYTDWVYQGLHIPHLSKPVSKAFAIRQSGNVELITAPKTSAFYQNLIGNLDRVTVDVWMYRAAGLSDDMVKPYHYREIELAVTRLANRYGIKPAQFQAIVWVAIRSKWKREVFN